MTESWMGDSGPSLLVRTAAVTVVVVGFFAIATGVIPVRCWVGGVCDGAPAEKTVAVLPATETPKAVVATPEVQPVAAKAAPTLTSNDVIAGTFAQLKVELNPPTRLPATTAPVQVAAAAPSMEPQANTITDPETGLSKRMVRAVTVRADGTPEIGSVAEAYAAGPRIALASPSPAVEAAARIGAGQQPAMDTQVVADLSPDTATDAPARAKGTPSLKSGQASVTGKGANVRASPSKAGKVLFALRGGEVVTIVSSKRGWMQVKDDQSRTGWIYGDALKRG